MIEFRKMSKAERVKFLRSLSPKEREKLINILATLVLEHEERDKVLASLRKI